MEEFLYKPPTAVVVDDSPELRLVITSLFKSLGVTAVAARDGESGLALVREQHPDIVCLDLMLPTVSGLEVCRSLTQAKDTADIPVLMVSARTFPQDRAEAHRAGASAYLTKPINRSDFLVTVRSLLWRRQAAVGA
ncbi:MAG: response regulator [Acidobacteriota bacterium]